MTGLDVCLVSAAYRPYPSGVSEHVHHLAAELRKLGHRVHVLTTNYGSGQAPEPDVTRLGRALVLPANRSRFTFPFSIAMSGKVKRFLSGNRFDVIHCHGIFPPEIAYYAASHARCPVVVTFHTLGVNLPGFVRAGFRALFPRLQHRVKARIAVSKAGRRWAKEWFPDGFEVIPNGVDTDRFEPHARASVEINRLKRYVLFVGRLEKRKGLEVLLRALPPVMLEFPHIKCVVVGSGPLDAAARRLAAGLRIEHRVRFVGPVPARELPGYYAESEVFVSPALGGEAMGIVLVEALACGRPVVASDIDGYNEVIEHDRSGVLFPAGDSDALSAELLDLLGDRDRSHRLAQQARKRALDFSWSSVARRVESVYRRVIG